MRNLGDETVEVGVGGSTDIKVALANVVDGFVVDEEGAVDVVHHGVRREHGVVGLDDGRRHLRRRVDGRGELRLLAELGRQLLRQQRREARAGAAAEGVVDEESLHALALLRHPEPSELEEGQTCAHAEGCRRRAPCRWCSGREHSCSPRLPSS